MRTSASGTSARMTWRPPASESMPVMWPRRVDRSAEMSPNFSPGTVTSIETIGSSSTGWACSNALRKAVAAGRLERLLRAVDRVVLAEVDLHLDVHDLVARDHPLVHLLAHALLDGRDELVGDRAPLDRVDEVEALAALAGPDPQVDLAELAAAAGLLLVPMVGLGLAQDRLEVGDVRHVGVHLQLVAGS